MRSLRIDLSLLVLCGLSTFLSIPQTSLAQLAEGTSCADDPTICTPAFMFCDTTDNICRCAAGRHFETVLDAGTGPGFCRLNVGEQCTQSPTEIECPKNGECSTTNVCNCMTDYNTTLDTRCSKIYGQPCANPTECDRSAFQQCHGTCTCGDPAVPSGEWYNPTDTKCYLSHNTPCDVCQPTGGKQQCVPDSTCTLVNTETNDRICQCNRDQGFLHHPTDNLCYLKHGEPCQGNNKCNSVHDPLIECSAATGNCSCTNPATTFLQAQGEELGMCKLGANSSCTLDPVTNAHNCVEHARCDCASLTCQCDSDAGWVATSVTAGMGNACRCNEAEGWWLDDVTTPAVPTCVRTHGSPCLVDADCSAVHNLICLENYCQCDPPTKVPLLDSISNFTRCVGKHGTPCSSHDDCNTGLACSHTTNGFCTCYIPEEQSYDNGTKLCYTTMGGRCNTAHVDRNGVSLMCESGLSCTVREGLDENFNRAVYPYDGDCSGGVRWGSGIYCVMILFVAGMRGIFKF